MIMSDDYIKHLEDALERAQTRLESELMGKAVINRVTTAERIGSLDPDKDSDIIEGNILVGGVIFAKIKKEKPCCRAFKIISLFVAFNRYLF